MKIVRFEKDGLVRYGRMDGETVKGIMYSPFCAKWREERPGYTGEQFSVSEIRLLVPCEPTKYIGVGLNFEGAARTLGREAPAYPITFMKPSGAVIPSGASIELKERADADYWFEGELAVVIKKDCRRVKRADAYDYIAGYTCTNDITNMAEFGHDDLKLKAADTYGPTGPCMETSMDPNCCRIRSWVNGELRQDGNSSEFIFDIPYMIEFISDTMTLYPGDILAMGTPAGAGPCRPGDRLRIEVEGIGILENTVVSVK